MVVVMQFALVRGTCNVITVSGAWMLEFPFWFWGPIHPEKRLEVM